MDQPLDIIETLEATEEDINLQREEGFYDHYIIWDTIDMRHLDDRQLDFKIIRADSHDDILSL